MLVYFGDGKGGFPGPDLEVEGVQQPFGMDAADLNRDGKLDMAVVGDSPRDSKVTIMLGDGVGGFTISTFSVDLLPTSIKIGDLNNDGKPDIVVAGAQATNTTGNFITTYLGNGRGVFALKQDIQLGQGSLKGDIALGDFNEDGKLDVAFPQTRIQMPIQDHGTKFSFSSATVPEIW